YLWLCIMALPLGLGAGSVDAALNNFVALHYEAKHMSWLHCFWGIGATAGPVLLSLFLGFAHGWKLGIRAISLLQGALVILLVLTLPLWKRAAATTAMEESTTAPPLSNRAALRLPGLPFALLTFCCYCGAELCCGLWASSFLVGVKGVDTARAAAWVSLYYGGITVGRLLSGFVMTKISCAHMIRLGGTVALCGSALLLLPLQAELSMVGLVVIGLGCAPVYPCMIHETPARFGKENSQVAMGLQMAVAYVGSTLLPPLFGILAQQISVALFPLFLLFLFAAMLFASEVLQRRVQPL
ncbi:MAG: MFS transporter, partial [Pygmaiobacter sp.]